MNALIGNWLFGIPWEGILTLVVDTYIKASVICVMAGLLTLLLRRSSAYTRSIVWIFTIIVLLVLPLAHFISPIWQLPIIPEVGSWWTSASLTGREYATEGDPLFMEGDFVPGAPAGTEGKETRPTGYRAEWPALLIIAWSVGTIICFSWFIVRLAFGGSILRRSGKADPEWEELLKETSAELGLKRRIRLLESGDLKAAITLGAINPTIVLPAGSSGWPVERRRYVLSHEIAHVKRWDGLIEVLVLILSSIYWLNPIVWISINALRIERERDCDDMVLKTGARPSDYALFLMDIAAELGAMPRPVWRLSTISQGSNLKDRIMCILNPKIDRSRGKRWTVFVSCILLAFLIVPLSTSGIWETRAQEKSKKEEKKKQEELELEKKEMELKKKEMELKKKDMELKKKMSNLSAEERIKLTWEKIKTQENSAAVLIHDVMVKKGPEVGAEKYKKLKASESSEYYFKENEFNTLGYLFLHDKKLKEAITVFKLNVEAYPDSWNVYDSCGEAYLAAGKLDAACKCYKKSLALNPDNENGKEMLAKIAEKEKKSEPVAKKN